MKINIIHNKDCLKGLKELPDNSIDTCISSPPYWSLRNYEMDGQIGQENNYKQYIANLIAVYNEVYRVLKPTGTCFVNLGDIYSGSGNSAGTKNRITAINGKSRANNNKRIPKTDIKNKSLLMLPERFAIEMIQNGWILRNQIIWYKKNQMPSSAKDRFTVDFEKIFFFVKQPKYYFEQQTEIATGYDGRKDIYMKRSNKYDASMNAGVKKPKPRWRFKNLQDKGQTTHTLHENRAKGIPEKLYPVRNMRTVWEVNTKPFSEAHFAVFPEKLVKRMIIAGCPENGTVLDPFMGAGTTAVVARKLNRNYIGYELNPEYIKIANNRLQNQLGIFYDG